ncbi:MAG: MnhB domain-containing protein [Acidimicrobiales bacterium]
MIAVQSSVARLGVALATPLALVIGVYLLFAGHNHPGGGFAAGLVFGCVLALHRLTAIQSNFDPSKVSAVGILIVVVTAALPLFWGDALLDQLVQSVEIPVLGKVKSGTALPFDIGVTLIVLGLVAALLDGLGVRSAPQSGDSK